MQRASGAAAVVAALVMASCGGGGSTPTNPSGGAPAGAITITITRQNGAQSFSPSPASAGGRVVVFRNADTIPHRVQLNDGTIDTGNIAPGATSQAVTMPASGAHYHCTLHPDMTGAVNAASGDTPPCEGQYCTPGYY